MSHWVRLWEGMPTDPKWRIVKTRALQIVSSVSIGDIVSVFACMLTNADNKGNLGNWCDEDIAAALEYKTEVVTAIRNAMQGKVLNGMQLISWDKRQPKDWDYSTERVRAFRKRKRLSETPETAESESESESESKDARAREALLRAPRLSAKEEPPRRVNGHATNMSGARGGSEAVMAGKMTDTELESHKETHLIYVRRETPAGEAWAEWTRRILGKGQVWDSRGGWYFPSEWPPQSPSGSERRAQSPSKS